MFSKTPILRSTDPSSDNLARLRRALEEADTVILGAGAGLSTSAGFVYDGERFHTYFSDFARIYGFQDMYSGGFYPYACPEIFWAYWSRYIYVNRYMDPPKPVYDKLFQLVKDKDYFVLTTNVDHCFQKAGFDKKRLFYTQGDYGLFQCSTPCCSETFDNYEMIRRMVEAQGFTIAPDGTLQLPQKGAPERSVPKELLPTCPHCGQPLTTNLRSDNKFVEDDGWEEHAQYYDRFLAAHQNTRTLFLELGVGYNTPGIIKLPFWQRTHQWPNATFACLNFKETQVPDAILDKSICIRGDIGDILDKLEALPR
jgi:NAD-dependent SIR2 family protein deacetylase